MTTYSGSSRPLTRWLHRVSLLSLALASMSALCQADPSNVVESLRKRMPRPGAALIIQVEDLRITVPPSFVVFYEARKYQPAWTGDSHGQLQLVALAKAIGRAGEEGLRPADYVSNHIGALLLEIRSDQNARRPVNVEHQVDLDFLVTHAFLTYSADLLFGRYNPNRTDQQVVAAEGIDLAHFLESTLQHGRVAESLSGLLPRGSGYDRLRDALARYKEIASRGGWPGIDPGPTMQKGDRGPRIEQLRLRLLFEGSLAQFGQEDHQDRFDDALEGALRSFQQRHGLDVDGVAGPATLSALNVPAIERVHQIKLNMDRRRWLPRDPGSSYLLVNVPDFRLQAIDGNRLALEMSAIVGKRATPTPLFDDEITYIEFNPHWRIPDSIARWELLPMIRKDQQLLSKRDIKILDASTREIDPANVSWEEVTPADFGYRLLQEPGPLNPLGRVKFGFARHTAIHLHDTPARELFQRTARAFSHGCVRLERAADLAEYLLRDDTGWSRQRIQSAMDQGVEQVVRLGKPVRAYFVYWTAWADESGAAHFRSDLYHHDQRLLEPCQQ